MKTPLINWNNVTIQQAAEIFQQTFGDNVNILPTIDVYKDLKKACLGKQERTLEFVENDDHYDTTTYSFDSNGGLKLYADIDAETGDTSIGSINIRQIAND